MFLAIQLIFLGKRIGAVQRFPINQIYSKPTTMITPGGLPAPSLAGISLMTDTKEMEMQLNKDSSQK